MAYLEVVMEKSESNLHLMLKRNGIAESARNLETSEGAGFAV